MRPVRRAEGIVDVGVGEVGQPARERLVVAFLARVEPQVLQQHDRVLGQCRRRRLRERHDRSVEQPREHAPRPARAGAPLAARPSAGRGARRARRAAPRSRSSAIVGTVARIARVVGDLPVGERHVEVRAHEHPRRRRCRRGRRACAASRRHRRSGRSQLAATSAARSTRRLEYPHSLSYQPTAFTTLPIAIVAAASNVHDACEPTMSLETIGSSVYTSLPASGATLGRRLEGRVDLVDGDVAARPSATRSVTEPSGTGTRIDMPSSLPFRCGSTSPVALAAPVERRDDVHAAARARRRSLCGRSRICWSFV